MKEWSMNPIRYHFLGAMLVLAALGLCPGCGGSKTPSRTASNAGRSYRLVATPQGKVGKNTSAVVLGQGGALSAVKWTQVEGQSVELLSDKTQAISFVPTVAGTYRFSVSFKDGAGKLQQEVVSIPVTGSMPGTNVTLRGTQAVRMGGNVSLRLWPSLPTGVGVTRVTWRTLEGPDVSRDTTDPATALFTAPTVSQDTLVRLGATIQTSTGQEDSDEAYVVVERYTQASANDAKAIWGGEHISRVYPYVSQGPYAGVLVQGVYDASLNYASESETNLPTLARLPLLAQETGGGMPTIEQVMNRVLTSHDWIARNFENMLRTQDPQGDIRRMLNSVTAVVLGVHVRPSFYSGATGAIYLDADNLWMTPEERDTINETPDYRSGFGSELQFTSPWRYVKNNAYATRYINPDVRTSRTLEEMALDVSQLLYHELAHAADFIPPSSYASLNNALTVYDNILARFNNKLLTSDVLHTQYPLNSSEMLGLAHVSFQGVKATAIQKAYTPTQVGQFFSSDRATDPYSYVTYREDVAMCVEEFMMALRHGIQRDCAFADQITSSTTNATWYVRWGQRGRVGHPALKPRVRLVVERLLPWIDASAVDTLPAPKDMRAGDTWQGNLVQAPSQPGPLSVQGLGREDGPISAWERRRWTRRHHVGFQLPLN